MQENSKISQMLEYVRDNPMDDFRGEENINNKIKIGELILKILTKI